MANFGSILKDLRTSRGITQGELATMLDVSRSTVGMYETGGREPDFETMEAIADIFNVDMDYLMGRSQVERKHPISPPRKEIPPGFLRYAHHSRGEHQELYRCACCMASGFCTGMPR